MFFLMAPNKPKAQTCSGSLGDPLLNETFGYLHQPLPAYKTSYDFTPGCPRKGQYTINDFLYGCGPMTWAKTTGDHTPYDSAGCYMLVNAESTAGTIYRDTIKGVCGNTVYQFQLWVTAVMTKYACGRTPRLPNVKFTLKTLSGAVLARDSTGYLTVVEGVEWKPYGFSLRTPLDITDAIIEITIDPEYGCGCGFALDDITFRPCGPLISVNIDGTPGPADVCADYIEALNPFVMTAQYSDGFADPLLQWQSSIDSGFTWVDIPGETGLVYKMPHRYSGLILYRICIAERSNINSLHCRITSNVIYTRVHPLAAHAAPQNMLGCLNKIFFFPAADPHALQVLWSGPGGYKSIDFNSVIPAILYKDTGLYKLKETFYFNCVSLDTFYLNVLPSTTISVVPGYPLCEGQSETLSVITSDTDSYKWTPSTGLSSDIVPNPLAKPSDSTKYKVLATNVYGCQDSAYVEVDVYRNPVANAGPDKFVLLGDTARLSGYVKGTAVDITWSPPVYIDDSHFANPHVYPPQETIYTLKVLSTVGCGSAADDVLAKVYDDIFIPNAFTPNGDFKNDKFQVIPLDNYRLVGLLIYNRWGQLVFKASGVYKAWDGTVNGAPQPPGAYVYHLELRSSAGRRVVKNGTVLLIR